MVIQPSTNKNNQKIELETFLIKSNVLKRKTSLFIKIIFSLYQTYQIIERKHFKLALACLAKQTNFNMAFRRTMIFVSICQSKEMIDSAELFRNYH